MQLKKVILSLLVCFFTSAILAAENPAGLHLDWIDHSVNPGKNFFKFANGNWQKKNAIPAAYSHWGTIEILQEQNLVLIKNLIEAIPKDHPTQLQQQVRDFYQSGMDEKSINSLGIKPLITEIQQIDAIQHSADLQKTLAHLQLIGVNALFDFSQMQDYKDSQKVIGVATQSGLSLPDRDYYLKKDSKFKLIRQAYITHMTNMFMLMGDDQKNAAREANIVLNLETRLAKASLPGSMIKDPQTVYHIKNLQQLQKITPNFSWKNFFKNINHAEITTINLATPHYFKVLNSHLSTIAISDWKIYLRWQLIHHFAPYLSDSFVKEDFKMTAVLNGTQALLPRWKRIIAVENEALGFAVGKLYVEKNFSPASKKAAQVILNNIRESLRNNLKHLAWMNPKTRTAAIKKLDLMEEKIGYPEKWIDYSSVKIYKNSYLANIVRTNEFLNQRELNKIGKPVDKTAWDITPQEVNAYYDASLNRLNIPAGILKPPFFDPDAPAAVNYGAIGFVMGHEMTHGFDEQGAKFDGYGNVKNWWTPDSLDNFHQIIDKISEQFSHYKIEGLPIQGDLVSGEATADLGGLTLAYQAFHQSNVFKDAKTIDGVTPDQQFFLGAAHVWATNIRPEEARNTSLVDPHPPAIYRVNGTLANMKEFQQAFNLSANQKKWLTLTNT